MATPRCRISELMDLFNLIEMAYLLIKYDLTEGFAMEYDGIQRGRGEGHDNASLCIVMRSISKYVEMTLGLI